ncbi:Tn7 transposase TnsA N-terminal domain-containing protein [Shewanella sp. 1180_01]|uniref:Tn7 transposase TnsA N-terminal domain-containing protein n=1 Tax=Shewanella sp. 1180_01 TaxID=2604451 RepID=UPI004063E3E7
MKPRKIPRHSKVMARIHFHSQKNDSTRFCDSELEVARLLLLEFEDDVIAYNTQPASFTYLINGKNRRYTPDLIISHKHKGVYFEEIKPKDKLGSQKNIEKFDILSKAFAAISDNGLKLVTEEQIYVGSTIANLKKLYHYRSLTLSEQCQQVMQELPARITYCGLISWAESHQCHVYDPMILLANRCYTFDLTCMLSPLTHLERSYGSTNL